MGIGKNMALLCNKKSAAMTKFLNQNSYFSFVVDIFCKGFG